MRQADAPRRPPATSAAKLRRAVEDARRAVSDPATDEKLQHERARAAMPKYGQICWDMRGREHDLVAMRGQRNAAVTRGLRHMFRFFKKKKYEALHDIGDDAPSIFFECWYTSLHSKIRTEARAMCLHLLPVYERKLLELTAQHPRLPPPARVDYRRCGKRATTLLPRGCCCEVEHPTHDPPEGWAADAEGRLRPDREAHHSIAQQSHYAALCFATVR